MFKFWCVVFCFIHISIGITEGKILNEIRFIDAELERDFPDLPVRCTQTGTDSGDNY